jgi:voltage-gated potassium channel
MIILSDQVSKSPDLKKPTFPIILLIIVMIVGSIGYKMLWAEYGATWMDAFYMVIITVTTLGYSEIYPMNEALKGFTIVIAVSGIGSFFYIFGILLENLLIIQNQQIRLRKKVMKNIEHLSDHFIIVGLGRVGNLVANELQKRHCKFVIIEGNIDEHKNKDLGTYEYVLSGDATNDEVLKLAGIAKAQSIIVATSSITTNLFVVLSARQLNKDIKIVARNDDDLNAEKLIRAGANKVINPYNAGGVKMAAIATGSNILDYIDSKIGIENSNFNLEIITLSETCNWIGKTLIELNIRSQVGVTILGVVRGDETIYNPKSDFQFMLNDKIIVVGAYDQINKLEELFSNSMR